MASPAEKSSAEGSLSETLRVESQRFGTMDVPADRIFRFGSGLIGFPSAQRFVLLDHRPGSPFKWMLCLEDPRSTAPHIGWMPSRATWRSSCW